MIDLGVYAQTTLPEVQYYYVEEKMPDLLQPTSQNRLADHSLDLTFSRTSLQSFFDTKTVYVYKKAFPGAINPRLQNFEGYDLNIRQLESTNNQVLGGFTYTFTRDNNRQEFTANDETEVGDDNIRTIKATNINEPATYNWYDEDGKLIYSGDELIVNTAIAKEYKLEVIAESDGHKDYHTVVTDDLRKIISMSPNPANTQVTLQYLIESGDNAIIKLTHVTNGTFYNYMLNNSQDIIDIDLTNFSSGQYIVNLIAGGEVLNSQNLFIN